MYNIYIEFIDALDVLILPNVFEQNKKYIGMEVYIQVQSVEYTYYTCICQTIQNYKYIHAHVYYT